MEDGDDQKKKRSMSKKKHARILAHTDMKHIPVHRYFISGRNFALTLLSNSERTPYSQSLGTEIYN